jgi:hypothetical protein
MIWPPTHKTNKPVNNAYDAIKEIPGAFYLSREDRPEIHNVPGVGDGKGR